MLYVTRQTFGLKFSKHYKKLLRTLRETPHGNYIYSEILSQGFTTDRSYEIEMFNFFSDCEFKLKLN